MRKPLIALAGLPVLVASAVAVAQTPSPTAVNVNATVSPSKAGTKAKPRGVTLKVHVTWSTPGDGEKPVVQKAKVLFPQGSLYNGAKFPSCSQNVLARKGPNACPKGAIMGHGGGDAYADTVITHPVITVVNGGATKVFLYTVLDNPARVQAPVPGVIKKLSGKWAYELDLTVPQSLQVVAGVPIALKQLTITAGHKNWLATTGCSGGKWPFSVETSYDTGTSSSYQDAVPCSK
jgi:hypothetical protein